MKGVPKGTIEQTWCQRADAESTLHIGKEMHRPPWPGKAEHLDLSPMC
jgi:hypothetical protein